MIDYDDEHEHEHENAVQVHARCKLGMYRQAFGAY